MYKNYIFDLYGTLVDIHTDESTDFLWTNLALFFNFKGADYTAATLEKMYTTKVTAAKDKITNTKYPDFPIEYIFEELYTDKNVIVSKDTIKDTAQFFRTLSMKYIKLYPKTIELLKELKSKGKNVYLLSNAQRIFTYYEMKMLDITKYFDDIFISTNYNVCKPDKQFFNVLINKLHVNTEESVMIGNDYICDIEGACSVNMDSIYIDSNLSPYIDGELKSTYSIMSGNLYDGMKKLNLL